MSEELKLMREEFEAHVKSECETDEYAHLVLQKTDNGFYHTTRIQGMWEGWQAAMSRRAASGAASVGLSDEEIGLLAIEHLPTSIVTAGSLRRFARALLATESASTALGQAEPMEKKAKKL